MQSEQTAELFTALSKAQAQMEGAKKGTDNPFFKSKYADLYTVIETARKPLADNGLCITQTIDITAKLGPVVITTLGHSSGQWIRGTCPVINTKGDAQGMGSAITYARRYSHAAICGLAQMDDDGDEAVKEPPAPKRMSKRLVDDTVDQVVACIESADDAGLREILQEFDQDEKAYLWRNFNSAQRGTIKEMLSNG